MVQKKARENYQNLPEKGKTKSVSVCNRYRKIFIEKELNVNIVANYI